MSIFTTSPEVRCPHCIVRFDHHASWELRLDDEIECPACNGKIVMYDEEAIRRWAWGKPVPTSSGAQTQESTGEKR